MDIRKLVGKVIKYKLNEEMEFPNHIPVKIPQKDRSIRTGLVRLRGAIFDILGTAHPQNIKAAGHVYLTTYFAHEIDMNTIQEIPLTDQLIWKLQWT